MPSGSRLPSDVLWIILGSSVASIVLLLGGLALTRYVARRKRTRQHGIHHFKEKVPKKTHKHHRRH